MADIEVQPWLPPLAAFCISLFTSMGGVSGAFLLLPFQMTFLGFTTPAVSATNQLFNVVAIPSGVYRYIKEGRMVWPLTWVVIIGTLPGVLVGAIIRINYLPDPKNFKFFAGLVLLFIGAKLIKDLLAKNSDNNNNTEEDFHSLVQSFRQKQQDTQKLLPRVLIKKFSFGQIIYEFYGQTFIIPTMGVMLLSLVVGVVGGIYGIGGGAIIAPFFISVFGLPVYTVAGAALMGTFVTSVAGIIFYQAISTLHPNMSISPDWSLGFMFGIGGFTGMYCGASLQKFIPSKVIKIILVFCIFIPALKYIIEFYK